MPLITDIWYSHSVIFACSTEQVLHVVNAGVDEHVAAAGVESSTIKFGSILDSKYKMKGLLSGS